MKFSKETIETLNKIESRIIYVEDMTEALSSVRQFRNILVGEYEKIKKADHVILDKDNKNRDVLYDVDHLNHRIRARYRTGANAYQYYHFVVPADKWNNEEMNRKTRRN